MSQTIKAYLACLSAFVTWGLFPIFVRVMNGLRADEFLYVRIVFSLICIMIFFAFKHQIKSTIKVIWHKSFLIKASITAILLAINWLVYIVAVNLHQTMQASVGYFITPLVNVAFGFLIFKEKLDIWTKIALFFGVLGLVTQMLFVDGNHWLAPVIGLSWGVYGGLRKLFQLPPMQGLFAEILILTPFAIFLWARLGVEGQVFDYLKYPHMILFAIAAGIMTLVPLICFLYAVPRLNLSNIALLQYITPTLQFLVALLYFHEPFNPQRFISFLLIWIGLGIYSIHLLSHRRKHS